MRYFDVKKGIPTADVISNPEYNEFAKQLYRDLFGAKHGTYEQFLIQRKKKDGRNKHLHSPLCGIFPSLCSDMLEKFLDDKPFVFSYNDSIEPEREYIADLIYTVSCARDNNPIQ